MIKSLFLKVSIISFFIISNLFVGIAHATFYTSGQIITNDYVKELNVSAHETETRSVQFNNDGTKMFITGDRHLNLKDVHEFSLSTPFDISTATHVVTIEINEVVRTMQIKFNNDGSKMFLAGRLPNKVFEYSLSTNFDISTATYSGNVIDVSAQITEDLFGFEFNNDGTMMYISDTQNNGTSTEKIYQYSLSKSFDFSSGATLVRSVDLEALHDTTNPARGEREPAGMHFTKDGLRLFVVGTQGNDVNQYTLSESFNIATASFDGGIRRGGNPTGIAFNNSGLSMFITGTSDLIREYKMPCPFSLFVSKCKSINDGDRIGMAEAQINIAKKTIEYSTSAALNRLQWIRRNKDLQDLSFQNIKFNFSNEMLASLSEAILISTKPRKKDKNKAKDIFYWSEGSLAYTKVQETDISSKKRIFTDGITIGVDSFTEDKGIKGLAFRYSQNDVIVGTTNKLDTDTYNLTYYSTTPVKNESKFLDTVLGVGFLNTKTSNIIDSIDGDRFGEQIYGTLKLKDEIKKDNLTLIPAGQIDLGFTVLRSYSESGIGATRFDQQSIQSRNLRLSIASVEELNNKKFKMKRHGKMEYQANLDRSSKMKYSYIGDSQSKFETKLKSGALHNINSKLGFDVIYDENLSLFFILEHNYAHKVGYTGKVHFAIGYLPQKNTNLSFKIEGDDILKSKYIYSKNIDGLDIEFYLMNNDVMRPKMFDEIAINLKKVF